MLLRTLLGDYPNTEALKKGDIRSDLVDFTFADYSPPHTGFKAMVRERAFDVSEMAIVTYLIGKAFDEGTLLRAALALETAADFKHSPAKWWTA